MRRSAVRFADDGRGAGARGGGDGAGVVALSPGGAPRAVSGAGAGVGAGVVALGAAVESAIAWSDADRTVHAPSAIAHAVRIVLPLHCCCCVCIYRRPLEKGRLIEQDLCTSFRESTRHDVL